MPERLEVKGLREIEAALKGFTPALQKRAIRQALGAGARVVRDAARANAPVRTGVLKRNIQAVVGKINPAKGIQNAYIGEETGKVGPVNAAGKVEFKRRGKLRLRAQTRREKRGEDPYYYRFQEIGFTAVGRRKARSGAAKRRGGSATGTKVPGKRFLTRAFEANVGAITDKFKAAIAAFIEKYKP